jgi:molybdopterin synthase sulfur carrier subunit
MKITIRFFGALKAVIGSREINLELGPARTNVGDLPKILNERYGEKVLKLLQGKEEPFDYLRVLINGQDHLVLQGLETELKDGDIITLLPPLSGGIGESHDSN